MGEEVVLRNDHVGTLEDGVVVSLDLVGMATFLPVPENPIIDELEWTLPCIYLLL